MNYFLLGEWPPVSDLTLFFLIFAFWSRWIIAVFTSDRSHFVSDLLFSWLSSQNFWKFSICIWKRFTIWSLLFMFAMVNCFKIGFQSTKLLLNSEDRFCKLKTNLVHGAFFMKSVVWFDLCILRIRSFSPIFGYFHGSDSWTLIILC